LRLVVALSFSQRYNKYCTQISIDSQLNPITICFMTARGIKKFLERQPFRPFTVLLANGTKYSLNHPRDFGAPKDYHIILRFGKTAAQVIEAESIVKIVDK
jgi:hypothetical protein